MPLFKSLLESIGLAIPRFKCTSAFVLGPLRHGAISYDLLSICTQIKIGRDQGHHLMPMALTPRKTTGYISGMSMASRAVSNRPLVKRLGRSWGQGNQSLLRRLQKLGESTRYGWEYYNQDGWGVESPLPSGKRLPSQFGICRHSGVSMGLLAPITTPSSFDSFSPLVGIGKYGILLSSPRHPTTSQQSLTPKGLISPSLMYR